MANKELITNSTELTLEQKTVALLMCTAQELLTRINLILKPYNLSTTQVQILHILDLSAEGRMTVSEIRQFMVDHNPNVSRSLNALMKQGYITKNRCAADQRVVYIQISPEGREIQSRAYKELISARLDISKTELNQLYKILQKL